MAWRWHSPTLADLALDDEAAPPGETVERLLHPAVLERYLLLLSLDVQAERMLEEHRRRIAEIDRAQAAGEPLPTFD
jgi:hypothetical protein